jgi:peptide/nickel transport system ATP-binding protein
MPAAASGAPLLELRSLQVSYPGAGRGVTAVRGVDLELRTGETLALVGESGSGKSTLGRAALRLLRADSGQVLYRGTDLVPLTQRALRPFRRRMQLVFQDPHASLDPRMTVGQQIAEVYSIHRLFPRSERQDRAAALLDLVGLRRDLLHRHPHALSGGQRQRVGLARALAVDPELVVLDEPLSSLDVSIQAQILNLLVEVQRQRGLSYLFIAHDLRVVRFLADRTAVMQRGRIVEVGATDNVFENPVHPYTQALLQSRLPLDPGGRP